MKNILRGSFGCFVRPTGLVAIFFVLMALASARESLAEDSAEPPVMAVLFDEKGLSCHLYMEGTYDSDDFYQCIKNEVELLRRHGCEMKPGNAGIIMRLVVMDGAELTVDQRETMFNDTLPVDASVKKFVGSSNEFFLLVYPPYTFTLKKVARGPQPIIIQLQEGEYTPVALQALGIVTQGVEWR